MTVIFSKLFMHQHKQHVGWGGLSSFTDDPYLDFLFALFSIRIFLSPCSLSVDSIPGEVVTVYWKMFLTSKFHQMEGWTIAGSHPKKPDAHEDVLCVDWSVIIDGWFDVEALCEDVFMLSYCFCLLAYRAENVNSSVLKYNQRKTRERFL